MVADIAYATSARQKVSVRFCACYQSDQTRLIYMGFIGGSPTYPKTAFSLRLLRFYHITWKYCTTRVEPYARALDEFLDAYNPLILTKTGQVSCSLAEKSSNWLLSSNKSTVTYSQPRLWATPLYWAIDAYRKMLVMTEQTLDLELDLTPLDKLAENCPRCFGPPVKSGVEPMEPDIIVSVDGNFQHRRHLAAGQKAGLKPTIMPHNFLSDEKVAAMKQRIEARPDQDFVRIQLINLCVSPGPD